VPKRRGPDKRPGTRKRSCKKRQSDGSDPQPKKKRRADPADQGSNIAHASYSQYEISPVAVPMFGPSHQRPNKVDTEPPTASLHGAYYVKVSPLLPSLLFQLSPHRKNHPDLPKKPPSPTLTQPPSTSRSFKSEIQSGQTFPHPFESDPCSPELSSYEDTSPPLVHTSVAQYSRRMWWDELLDDYSSTREQAYVMHTFHLKRNPLTVVPIVSRTFPTT
jgi:hypothetical protein